MKILLDDHNKGWDEVLIQVLWAAWKRRPKAYTDANGVSMMMQIESAFKATGVEEPKIDLVKTVNLAKFDTIQLEIQERYGLVRADLTIDQAKELRSQLDGILNDLNQ